MASKHLYPCPQCENSLQVETTQAGQDVTCPDCQHSFKLGSLRDIRSFPEVETAKPVQKPRTSRAQNVLFMVAFAMFFAGLGMGMYFQFQSFKYLRLSERPKAAVKEEQLAIVDQLTPLQLLYEWGEMSNPENIARRAPPTYLLARREMRKTQSVANIGYAIGGIGAVFLATLLVVRRRI